MVRWTYLPVFRRIVMRIFAIPALILASGASLSGCASYYGGYGGYGGYSGVSVGISSGGYYDPYYGGSGYYGGSPYWGWNDGYYYPGTGYYVYDSYRRPYRWSDAQRRYWSQRRAAVGTTTTSTKVRPNWSGFSRPRATTTTVNRAERQQRNQSRIERRQSSRAAVSTSTERTRRDRQPD
jgi:hypothetical protein